MDVHAGEAIRTYSEHSSEYYPKLLKTLEFEYYPSEQYNHKGIYMPHCLRHFILYYELLKKQEEQIPQSPEYIIPACSVPQSSEEPYYRHVPYPFACAHPVSSQRYIYIISEKGA